MTPGTQAPRPGAARSDGIIGVIVVNFGSHELIDANLTGVGLIDHVCVVVVDNFSGRIELDAIRELTARRGWTLVELSENRGFGAGANAGARAAIRLGAECLLFLNPDVVIDAYVVDEIRRQCLIAPETLVSPRVLTASGDVYFIGTEVEMAGGRMRRAGRPGSGGAARAWLSGACLGMGTTMFEMTGGMNERFFMYWEDVDLSLRAVAAGGTLVVREDLFVTHDEGGTQGTRRGRAKSSIYYYYNCRNRLLFATQQFGTQQLARKDILRWMARTPGASWEILMRGGRRQLVQSPEPLLAAIAGSLAGLGIAGRALLGTHGPAADGQRAPVASALPPGAGQSGDPLRVTVAVLTYRRPAELARGLPELVHQASAVAEESNGRYSVDVLVVDNDPAGSAAEVAGAHPLVRYRSEPRPGVSAARNCALDAASDADLLAFIDDDERPHPEWLSRLVRTQRQSGAAAVAGRVLEAFDREPDSWIRAGRFFQRPSLPTGQQVHAAGAGNLLLDLRQIRSLGLRFDDRFGLSGGEDTHFTATLRRRGGSIVWCNEAVVTDQVPAARATHDWVLHRAWSHGNTDSLIDITMAETRLARLGARLRALTRGSARIAGGGARSAWGRISGDDRHDARGQRAVWRGAGMMAGAVGKVYQEYARPAGRLTVLESFPESPPRGNPFRVLLADSLAGMPDLELKFFSWRSALLSRYDVFHVHWPEVLIEGRDPLRRFVRQGLFLALLVRLRLSGTPIVRTVHNLDLPQDISRREVALLRLVESRTSFWIRINSSTPIPAGHASATIPHGHYRDWYDANGLPASIPGRFLFFGLVRRYKSVDSLIIAFRQTRDPNYSLHVVGQPSGAELADRLRSLAAEDVRIDLTLSFQPDDDLVRAVGEAELVVLPYSEMHNSAGVLTTLSLARPVLVPDNDVNRRLAEEVGPGWVYLYSGALTGTHLDEALRHLRDCPPAAVPNLNARDWARIGRDHADAFRRAAAGGTRDSTVHTDPGQS